MKKLLLLAALLAGAAGAEPKTVAIAQIIDHPALNEVRRGLEEEIKAQGLDVNYEYENAQGNNAIALQIAEKFIGGQPAVLVGLGTPAAQALANGHGDIPLVFSAVTDPVAAKLVSAWDKTDGQITGVSDRVAVEKNVSLIKELLPQVKKVGTIYNGGEANAVAAVKELKEALAKENIELVEAAATKTSEVQEAGSKLLGQVDALYIVQDNTVVSALATLVDLCEQGQIPLFTADTALVKQGALAAISFDYYQVGRSTGGQVAAILKGKKIADMPVTTPKDVELLLNQKAADKIKLTIPAAVRDRAKEIIK